MIPDLKCILLLLEAIALSRKSISDGPDVKILLFGNSSRAETMRTSDFSVYRRKFLQRGVREV